jgi:hypothetical protein
MSRLSFRLNFSLCFHYPTAVPPRSPDALGFVRFLDLRRDVFDDVHNHFEALLQLRTFFQPLQQIPTCVSIFSKRSSMGSPNGRICPCFFTEIYDICLAQRISPFFSGECSPSADPRNRLLAALRQCEIVLVGCPAHIPSEGEVVCPKKSISHPTNATVAISLISLRTRLRKPRPSVKNAQFVWATPKLTSTSLFSSTERWSKSSVQEEILSGIPEEKADPVANDHAVSLRTVPLAL